MHIYIANLPRKFKSLIILLSDIILLPLALWSAIALRYGTLNPDISGYKWVFIVLPLTTIPIFVRIGLYRAVIRYMDDKVITTVFYGVTLSVLLLISILSMAKVTGLPRSSIIIYWVMSIAYISSSRYLARGILRTLEHKGRHKQKVAIYGAGRAGLQTALALLSSPEYRPILFFDDNAELHGRMIAGIRVYNPEEALEVMEYHSCYQLLLAVPSATRSKRKEIIQKFEGRSIFLKTIPGMGDIVEGSVKIDDIREVGIEDLLGRDPVPPFENLISACIENKVVMVTGAGGSIGGELCRQILNCKPKAVILFERSEPLLYQIERELNHHFKNYEIKAVMADVQNQAEVENAISKYGVETIYHAAAYKHVPLVENNLVAGIVNNVFGTLAVAQASINCKVQNLVLISTDKAVRPTNVMGATKRMAEIVLQALAEQRPTTTLCMVRFGNVLGSSGSVVPLFKEQIRNGGPITVTHPDVTRYFMTIPEAAQLVIQAGAMAKGGEVFVLDMGEPVKIVDLAKRMVTLSGLSLRDKENEDGDISIDIVGLRPGEKLYEELLIGNNVGITEHPRIMKASEDFIKLNELRGHLELLKRHCRDNDISAALNCLKTVVKEYQPAPNSENLND